ncbi:MAG: RNA 2',3'-cyclic phosphodiesterase [Candidatus Omnitrophota bacterium]
MTRRFFVAIDPGEEIRLELTGLIRLLRRTPTSIRWVAPHHIHLTLMFLGNIEEGRLPHIIDCLDRAVCVQEYFELHPAGLGAFPDCARPDTVWVGFDEGTEPLKDLASVVRKARQSFVAGGQPAKEFMAHMTIGRLKDPQDHSSVSTLLGSMSFRSAFMLRVRSIGLFESVAGSEGLVYDKIHEAFF